MLRPSLWPKTSQSLGLGHCPQHSPWQAFASAGHSLPQMHGQSFLGMLCSHDEGHRAWEHLGAQTVFIKPSQTPLHSFRMPLRTCHSQLKKLLLQEFKFTFSYFLFCLVSRKEGEKEREGGDGGIEWPLFYWGLSWEMHYLTAKLLMVHHESP